MKTIKKQAGFTLVEIAIVLVIIGLLLGGILKGQELITSARVRNLADQNSGIQAAYFGFIDRYRAVPGDMPAANAINAMGATAVNAGIGGDGNQQLNDGSFAEAAALWHHLSAAGFIAGNYPGNNAAVEADYIGTQADGTRLAPENAFLGTVLLSNMDEYLGPGAGTLRLAYAFGNNIPVNVMRELDVKIDDQLPRNGVLRAPATAVVGAGFGNVNLESGTGNCTVDSGGGAFIWDIDANEQNCNAIYIY